MSKELSLEEIQKEWHGTYKAYAIGFFFSILLTLISFILVIEKLLPRTLLIYSIVGMALIQGVVQLLFFLHLRKGLKPHWEPLIFYFMVLILLIIVVGSLWIMKDLDDRMMKEMVMDK
ncbi:MAG: cytochrome o ubiquinol oxidase subunit IV [Chlamydiae bacterium]|nr:cytochrome o ubiquinol oxidase subunit IV [Chlamydiota bacterium]